MPKEYIGYLMTWTEYERDWGCRHDGATLHSSQEEVKKFLENFYKDRSQIVPDIYIKNDSNVGQMVKINKLLSERLDKEKSFYLCQDEENLIRKLNILI